MDDDRDSLDADDAALRRGGRRRLVRLLTIGFGSALALHLVASTRAVSDPEPVPALAAMASRSPAPATEAEWTSRGGESLTEMLRFTGLSPAEMSHLAELGRPLLDPAHLPRGVAGGFARSATGTPSRIWLRVDDDRTLHFRLTGARWTLRLDSVPVRRDTVVVAGRVSSSLYSAVLSGDADRLSVAEKGDIATHLSRVFGWQIDFYRDVRPRDAFRLALEREVRPDGSVRRSRVLAAEYMRSGSVLTAHRFRPTGEPRAFFFDEGGEALRRAFLKAPLDLVRVTSRFGRGRYHPMLGRYQSHRGVDYAAPAGTPVRSTGEGRVERAGWWGDYGLVIEVRHAGDVRTRYAHLSAVENGIRPGDVVRQGETIGRVGATGLSTAPHLHYEFLLRGIATDPGRVDLPVDRPIPDADRERFARMRAAGWLLLSRVPWPGDPLVLAVGRRVGTGGHADP